MDLLANNASFHATALFLFLPARDNQSSGDAQLSLRFPFSFYFILLLGCCKLILVGAAQDGLNNS
jgi:hypothetical protein